MEKALEKRIIESLKKNTLCDKVVVLAVADCGNFEFITISLGSSTSVNFIIQIVHRIATGEIELHQVHAIDSYISADRIKWIEDSLK